MHERKIGGYFYLTFIGLALAIVGGFFVLLLWKGLMKSERTRGWTETPAQIVQSAIEERRLSPSIPVEYSHQISYRYSFDGEVYLGDKIRLRENPFFKERPKVEPWIEKYPAGDKVTAYVNPERPQEVVLEHESRAPGYSIWFPGLFFVGGLGLVFATWIRFFRTRNKEA